MNPRPIFGAIFLLVPERHHDQALIIMQRIKKFLPGWAGATLLGYPLSRTSASSS